MKQPTRRAGWVDWRQRPPNAHNHSAVQLVSASRNLPVSPGKTTNRAARKSGPNAPISVLGLSVRASNAAHRAGIRTVGQLAAVPDEVLLAHKQIGEKTRYELHDKLAQYLELNPDALLAEPAVHAESVVVDGAALLDERQLRWQPLTDDQTPVVALDLSRRTFQALFRAGIHTVAALASLSHDDLARVRSIGSTSIAEIETKLTTYPNKTASTNTSLSPPPLASVTNEPILHAISLVRLGLPQEINAQLGAAGLHMIGQLVDDMARHSHPPATQQAVADYMALSLIHI